jgi:AcrR family transcriptional regulator
MAERVRYEPIFAAAAPLPRGPHGLSRGQVAASQRTRLMSALTEVVAEQGYAASTVTEISRVARVSPKAFYEQFMDKLDCYLTSYETFAGVLLSRLATALGSAGEWHEFVAAALEAYLGSLEDDPTVARAFLVEIDAAGRAARERRRAAYQQFAALLKARHEQVLAEDPTLGPLPDLAYLALVHGVRELAADALDEQQQPKLRALAPDITAWVDAAIAGAGQAPHGDEGIGRLPALES